MKNLFKEKTLPNTIWMILGGSSHYAKKE